MGDHSFSFHRLLLFKNTAQKYTQKENLFFTQSASQWSLYTVEVC